MLRKSLSIIFVMILIIPLHTVAEETIKGVSELGKFELTPQRSSGEEYLVIFEVLWNQFVIKRYASDDAAFEHSITIQNKRRVDHFGPTSGVTINVTYGVMNDTIKLAKGPLNSNEFFDPEKINTQKTEAKID